MAASHIAGESIGDALRVTTLASLRGWASTLSPWNAPTDSPDDVASGYRQALTVILTGRLSCDLSVKAPSLNYDFGLLSELCELAGDGRVCFEFDSHDPESAGPTWSLIERSRSRYEFVMATIPSRWVRSVADAERAVELGIGVRLVKGQWSDHRLAESQTRQRFLALADRLAGRASHVAVASHDVSLVRETLRHLRACGTSCELQQLFSLPLGSVTVARDLGVPIRIYVPYGHPYLPYNIRHVKTRAAIAIWAVRNFVIGRPPQLLKLA